MDGLAVALARQSRFAEAEAEYRQLLDCSARSLGADHPNTLATMHNLANMYSGQGNYEEAEKLYRETLQIQQRVLGPDHPDTANTMTTLANTIRFDTCRNAEAEDLYRKSLEIELRVLGPDHPYTTDARGPGQRAVLGEPLCRGRNTPAADPDRAPTHSRATNHTDTLLSQYNLATVLKHENRYPEAEKLIRETLEAQTRLLDAK